MIKEFSEAVSYVKSNIDYPFDKISGYLEYADTKEHSGYVYVEKYTLHRDTYYAAKAGKPVCTRDGRKARIICFNTKTLCDYPIIALVENADNSIYEAAYSFGRT